MITRKLTALVSLFILVVSPVSFAHDKPEVKAPIASPVMVTTEHSAKIHGKKIEYKAIAGGTILKNDKLEPVANLFSTTYLRTNIKNKSDRPVTFIFNGGPGSASLWLHMGLFGPKRVVIPANGINAGAAPYKIVNNQYSLLDISDLVFIDPVGTGVSHVVGKGKNENYWGLEQDAKSVAKFIKQWLTKNNRWNSPKYLAGESYGTTRAAAVTQELQGGWQGVALNGVTLLSTVLDFNQLRYQPGNNRPYISYLPSMAAAAFYHDKVSPQDKALGLASFVEQARQFALNDYASALLQGSRLKANLRRNIITQLARFTGLKENYIDAVNLRISADRYEKELLRDQRKTIGRFDSRFLGKDYDAGGEYFDNDPSAYGLVGAFTAAYNNYLANDLNVKLKRPFVVISEKVNQQWQWKNATNPNQNVNVAPYIGKAQRENSQFKLFIGNGYFDFATPFLGTENTIADNGIDMKRVEMKYYKAGHMMYINQPSLIQLTKDLRAFYLK
ncbi:peptidase S10 [Shewanella sp. 202IG2-18]|uniref:S10 family peptidase n=1 Tax=Parashewanella hymeniacidonis TaxID=2807618 RepID=UPI0019605B2D|nr:peptidase S10 [Parashewanella hymeniacidonis]MBM7070457.1 peptidase S10 [Parashewanella hymeniacidonis]